MKLTLSLMIFLMTLNVQQPLISEMRSMYKKAAEEERAAKNLLELSRNEQANGALMMGYHGAAQMLMAKHVGNPFKKLSYFNKGKELFTRAIKNDPKDIELRFLRFTVQAETPAFLNYKQNLQEDKNLLLSQVQGLKDAELRDMILAYLVTSREISDSEKRNLN